jgi:hypothetical protein
MYFARADLMCFCCYVFSLSYTSLVFGYCQLLGPVKPSDPEKCGSSRKGGLTPAGRYSMIGAHARS